jgi:cell division protein FtsW
MRGAGKPLSDFGAHKKYGKADIPLFAVVAALVGFGMLMVYSASSYAAQINYGNQYYFLFKQLIGAIFGFAAMLALTFIDYHILEKFKYVILALSYVLLILVFIPGVGVENYGARRWINLPFFTLQASEICKLAFIIFTASYMAKNHRKMHRFSGLIPILAVGLSTCALIILEPNMSITICVALLMFVMLFMGGARAKHFIMVAAPVALAIPVLIIIEPYRLSRLLALLAPWKSP